MSPNDLRRTFASWLEQRGEDSLVVARLLGHKSTAMVERVYGHLGDEQYRRAVERLPKPPVAGEGGSKWVTTPGRSQRRMTRMTKRPQPPKHTEGPSEDDPSSEPGRTRTYDPRIKSPLLYQLSYEPEILMKAKRVRKALARPFATPTGFEPVLPA